MVDKGSISCHAISSGFTVYAAFSSHNYALEDHTRVQWHPRLRDDESA
jgi:hypothetical protein